LFDLDGTLIDSRADITAACNHVLVWAGREALPVETVSGFVGDGARSLLARAFALPIDSTELEPLLDEWQRYYVAHPVDSTRWMPGAELAVAELSARGIPLAVVTNKLRAVSVAILDALGAASRFQALYAGGDGPLKPSPEPITRVCVALGVMPRDVWVVGDGAQDIEAAHAANARSIAIASGFHSEARLIAAAPHAIFPSLGAFVSALGFST
jgi:phosphoglycolate phosphatase